MSAASPTSPPAASPAHSDGSPSGDHNVSVTSASQTTPHHEDDTSLPEAASTADGDKHPKGRRKRTTAEDKRILEEAFRNDAKPDKAARRDIVNRVSLNEREVQIWFQNRRQNDRRKSRPLTAQDIELLRSGGLYMSSSDPITSQDALSSFEKTSPASHAGHPTASFVSSSPAQTSPQLPRVDQRASAPPMPPSYDTETRPVQEVAAVLPQEPPSSQESGSSSQAFAQSQSSTVGYIANRRNLCNSWSGPSNTVPGLDGSFKFDLSPPTSFSSDRPLTSSKSQSNMRLSLSLEGKAEVISTQPSPERRPLTRVASLINLSEPRPTSLRRTHSDASNITLPSISSWSTPPPRLGRGRSRHVQAWESCADADTRDELTAQAEHESNGSAIAEISLLRSANSVLQPSSSKRNASLIRAAQPRQAKKAKFSRVSSSAARLETDMPDEVLKRKDVKSKMDFAVLLSPTDSDKENWSPVGEGNGRQRRPLPSGQPKVHNARRQAPILGERKHAPSLGRAKTAPTRHRPWESTQEGVDIFEDAEGGKGGEVDKFMAPEVSPSKKGDVDCAVGLLSLSMGAWR